MPAPGQSLLVAAALLAGRGELSLPALLLTAFAAAALGSAAGFEIGRRGGRALLRRLAREDRLARLEGAFRRSDAAVVSLGRFIDGLRQVAALAAGAFDMAPRRFHAWNLVGAALWTGTWGGGAFVFGRDLAGVGAFFHRARGPLLAGMLVVSLAVALWLIARRRSTNPAG